MKTIEFSEAPEQGTSAGRWALAGLSLSMLMPSLDTSIANAGLPVLAHAFSASFQAVQWVVLSYLLAITSFIVGAGRLGDLVGRRRLLLFGIGLFTVASGFCGAATSIWALIAARAAQGLGAAVMMALTVALVGETVPKEKSGSAMGLLGTMSALGTTLGPSLGGVLVTEFGWRTIFFVNVPLGVVAFVLAQRHQPLDRHAARRSQFDRLGTLLLALTLGAYALALTLGRGHFGALNAALLLVAVLGAVSFVRAEAQAVAPLIHVSMFQQVPLRARLAMSALVSTVMMATLVVGPFYLGCSLGLEPRQVGVGLSVGPLVAALVGVPSGRLVDRIGFRSATFIGLVGMTAGAALLIVLEGLVGYLGPLMLVTASYALFQAANNSALMANATPDQRGVVSAMLSLSRNLGLITGAAAMGAVFAFASGTVEVASAQPAAIATGMHVTFAVAGGVLVLAVGVRHRANR